MKKTIRSILLLISLFLNNSNSIWADETDRFIEDQFRSLHVPGASLVVLRDGKIIKSKGYGFADLQTQVRATTKTVYEIGSLTKQFTAVAIMILYEDGKIHLDDPISKFFSGSPESWDQITVRHLLNHTSGIRNHVAVPDFMDIFRTSITGKTFPTRTELLQEFYKLPLEFAPGESWAYDNTGYHLLGQIIEQISGKTYWQFLEERIFKPLRMNSTRSTETRDVVANRASGYVWTGSEWENRPVLLPSVGYSAGSLLSTAEDLAKWDNAIHREGLLKRSSLEIMWTPARTNSGELAPFDYGFGWFIEKYRGHRNIMHSGGTPGFSSVMHHLADLKFSVIILTNHADMILEQLALEIARIYEPELRYSVSDSEKEITAKLKSVFSNLLKGEYQPDNFTRPMQIHLGTTTGKSFYQWYAATGQMGDFSFLERERVENADVFRYKVILGANPYRFSFKILDNGRIAQIYCW